MAAKRLHEGNDILAIRKKSTTFKVPFALDHNNHLVSANNYDGGSYNDQALTCVECKQALKFIKKHLRQNVVVRSHFAHTSGDGHHPGESYWHQSAKHILCHENITFTKTCRVCDSTTTQHLKAEQYVEEQTWGKFKIDVMAHNITLDSYCTNPTPLDEPTTLQSTVSATSALLEVKYTHACTTDKIQAFEASQLPWYEIDAKDLCNKFDYGEQLIVVPLQSSIKCMGCEHFDRMKEMEWENEQRIWKEHHLLYQQKLHQQRTQDILHRTRQLWAMVGVLAVAHATLKIENQKQMRQKERERHQQRIHGILNQQRQFSGLVAAIACTQIELNVLIAQELHQKLQRQAQQQAQQQALHQQRIQYILKQRRQFCGLVTTIACVLAQQLQQTQLQQQRQRTQRILQQTRHACCVLVGIVLVQLYQTNKIIKRVHARRQTLTTELQICNIVKSTKYLCIECFEPCLNAHDFVLHKERHTRSRVRPTWRTVDLQAWMNMRADMILHAEKTYTCAQLQSLGALCPCKVKKGWWLKCLQNKI